MAAKWLQLQRAEFGRLFYYGQGFIFPVMVAVLAWFDIWIPSLVLLLISKWRSLFFPPRFWPVTFRTSIVDLAAGGTYLMLQWRLLSPLYEPGVGQYAVALALILLYSYWLVSLRHKETMRWHRVQGLIALLGGHMIVDNMMVRQDASLKVLVLFVVFYTVYRHLFFSVKEGLEHIRALAWALLACQFWLMIDRYYVSVEVSSGINLSLSAIFMTAMYYLSSYIYDEDRQAGGVVYYGIGMVVVAIAMITVMYGGGFGEFQ